MISVSTALDQIREGKVRALAGLSLRPMQQLPGHTAGRQTIPGFESAVWHGIAGPAGMDPSLVARVNAIFNQVLQVPAVRSAMWKRRPPTSSAARRSSSTPSSRAS